ncbi:CoA-binding protein [Lyngbya sp. CCY1209]|jgi:succinyl-CoA synthetase alpha subunit|uniref:succinate--CoA ligase subunit alpha n=1 Tax=Lyngbya sp. CCY1209 TaxID=2886103 RepID=UPI002D20A72B|nr:CoA-binding protein [Lyngbya sp. CCY1209]MEB3883899.1 CoA-binding protein [Lyngbya sp. CCY1209]
MNLTPDSKVIIQGLRASDSSLRAALKMKAYGTNVVAYVSAGRGGAKGDDIPVFDLVEQAQAAVGPLDTTVIFVHPYEVLDAALEAIDAGIRQLVIVTEGMPPLDMVRLVRKAEATETLVVGPNCPGIIVPDTLLLGTHPGELYTPGPIGLISRSSTLTYEVAQILTRAKFGQSLGVSIGSDLIVGSSFIQWLQILDEDDNTDAIVLVGEVGGASEEEAASYIAETIDKPVVAYIAGLHAPQVQLIGHASTIITSKFTEAAHPGTAQSKIAAFKKAKIPVATRPSQIPDLLKKSLKKKR